MIDQKIFKSYDIRGIYPQELDEAAAYLIGRAFALRVKKQGDRSLVLGSDMRLSGPALKAELVKGILAEGIDIVDIGLVPIDAVYFAVFAKKYPAGIMITASHNPKEYNGFKMTLKNLSWVRGEDLKGDVLNLPPETSEKKGTIESLDIMEDYIKHVLSFIDIAKIKPFKAVVDAGNGMAGKVVPLLEKELPIKIIPLNFELDGNFPAHPSNPLLPESQVQIIQQVKDNQADFGVIFDGDTDRLFFVDETGKFIRADFTLLILAREFLNREPGKAIAYNAICSKIVPEKIKEWGGVPIRTKVGFVNVSAGIKENDGVMGGELSAHYSFKDNGYADSGFIAWLILVQLLSQDGRKLSEIVKEFEKYFKSDEINLEVKDRQSVINEIKEKYTAGQQDELDGLTVSYNDWWFNVRPSNTEPLLRLTVEADTMELMKEKINELSSLITTLAKK